jgi:putative addiction module component (TIGR02574 family)
MSLTAEQVAEAALLLSNEDRARLADRLVESLDPEEGSPIHQLWAAEAGRRLEEVRSGKIKTIPGDEALAHVRKALGR